MPLMVCPCCAGAGAVEDVAGVDLTRMERQIFTIVQGAKQYGIGGRQLQGAVYGGRVDGGPEHGLSSIHVQIHRANKKLATVGRAIRATSPGVGALYRVVSL